MDDDAANDIQRNALDATLEFHAKSPNQKNMVTTSFEINSII